MAARSAVPRIIFVLLGLYGWLTALMMFLKHRRQAKDKEDRILQLTRSELDSNAMLQRILAILKAERDDEFIQDHLNGNELRQLPAFLEDLGSHWEFDSVSIAGAYDTLGREVIWADESKLMWQDEDPPRSDAYWRLFNKFAKAIQAERARRQFAGPTSPYPENQPTMLAKT
jgi:hypothetical protein